MKSALHSFRGRCPSAFALMGAGQFQAFKPEKYKQTKGSKEE
jgi:hypothetical protein